MSLPSAPAPPSSIEILAQASTAEPRNDSTSAGSRANSEFKSQKLSGSQRSLQLIGNALDAPSTIEASIYGGGAETDGGLDTVLDSSSIPVSPRFSIDAEIYQLTDPSVLSDWYRRMFLCEGMHRKRLENNEDLLENHDRVKLVRISETQRSTQDTQVNVQHARLTLWTLKLLQRGEELVEAQPTPTANILVLYGPQSARAGDADDKKMDYTAIPDSTLNLYIQNCFAVKYH